MLEDGRQLSTKSSFQDSPTKVGSHIPCDRNQGPLGVEGLVDDSADVGQGEEAKAEDGGVDGHHEKPSIDVVPSTDRVETYDCMRYARLH